jgi:hypothetical protein
MHGLVARWRLLVGSAGLAVTSAAAFGMSAGAAGNPARTIVRAHHRIFPHDLRGPLQHLGLATSPRTFTILMLVCCACYLVVLAVARAIPVPLALTSIATLHAIVFLGPPILSSDVFNYLGYARLEVVHHLNAYHHPLSDARHDPTYPFIGWAHWTTAYGPLFTLLSLPFGLLGVAAGLWTFKAVATLASLATVCLVGLCARRRRLPPGPAMLFLGLNPILLFFAVGGAHNDLLMMLPAVLGIYLTLAGRPTGPAAMLAGAAMKVSAGVAAPFALLGSRRRPPALAWAAGVVIVVIAATLLTFGPEATSFVKVIGREARMGSRDVPKSLIHLFDVNARSATLASIGLVVFALSFTGLLAWTWRGGDWLTAAGWAVFSLLVSTTYLLPWYGIWLLPFAALSGSRAQRIATLGLSALIVGLRTAPLLP